MAQIKHKLTGKRWPDDFHNRFFIGMHTVDSDQNGTIPGLLSGMDARDSIKRLADAGVDAVYFYSSCHCGNCFYPTEMPLAHMHSGLNGRDVFGEAADECQKRGMAFIAVYEFINTRIMDFGPREWRHYYPEPAPGNGPTCGFSGLCWNTGYGEFVAQQINEVSSRYPISGFYIDMLNHPGLVCCEGCARLFREACGAPPPRKIGDTPLYKAFRLWCYEDEARYLRELRKVVQSHHPDATVVNNTLLFYCEDLYETPAANDYITHDTTMAFGGRLGTVQHGALNSIYRSLARGQTPFEVLTDPILFGSLSVPPADLFNAIAATTRIQGGAAGYPGSMLDRTGKLNEAVLGLTVSANEFIKARQPWRAEGEPVRFAGLYLSQESEIFHASPDPLHRDNKPYFNCFMGAWLAAQREHLPLDVLTRRDLGRLGEYPVVILANTVCMSDLETDAFRQYVLNGGVLLATFETSLRNEWNEPRSNFALADVFGVDYAGKVLRPFNGLQLLLPAGRFPTEPWENPNVTLTEPGLACALRPGAEIAADMHDRYRPDPDKITRAIYNAYTKIEPAGPGIVVNRMGHGRCIYCAGKLFGAYLNSGIPTLRKLLLRWLIEPEITAKCPARMRAPASVEMSAWAQPERDRMLVHMLNYQSAPGRYQPESGILPVVEDVLPVLDAQLLVQFTPDRIKAAFLQPHGVRLDVAAGNGGSVIRIPKISIHEIVELQLAPGACPNYPAGNRCFDFPRMEWRGKIAQWLMSGPADFDPHDDGARDFSKWLPADMFLTDWSVAGLFAPDADPASTPEGNPDMDAVYAGLDGSRSWQAMTGSGQCPDGCVELASKCGNIRNTAGYAVTFLHSVAAQDVLFKLGNDDPCVVWINDKKVFKNDGSEKPAFVPDQYRFTAVLRNGENRLLVKKTNVGHGYKFYLRVAGHAHPISCKHRPEAAGRPVKIIHDHTPEWDGRGAGQI